MAENRTQKEIDIGLSQRSKSDLANLQKNMKATAATVAKMVSDMKAFQNLLKSDRLNAIAQTAGGTAAFRRGSAVREQIAADRTSAMGTPSGQQMAVAREQIGLMKQGLALTREEARYRAGMLTNYSQEVGLIRQVKTIQEAKARMSAIEARMGIDRQAGATREVATGQRFLDVYQQRIARLREIARLEAQAAAASARRSTSLNNYRNPDMEMARARADAGRKNTEMRLFGDGGAGLMKIQMGLMANYAALNLVTRSFREAVRFSVEFDDSLRNLQAITVLTHGGLTQLEGTLIQVADETKFSAVELANAAVTLGQAGLSIDQVKSSISSVALLATATGTDLAKAVDIATSTLGVFNMEASEMGRVADVMTSAVNNSKLNMEKLTLGLQYAGNIAAQSGVSFDELTASFGAMANAGIRSGSTLGTGMRQILIALQKPSKEFQATLDRLGLTMFDVDLRSKGLYGAMKNLRDAGFTAGDAIRSFEVRAAAAFNALSGNLDAMLELEQSFIDSAAAARANETQMQSLSNQSKRFTANLGAVVTIGIKPMTLAARDMLQWLADAMAIWKDYPNLLRAVTVGFTSLVTTFAAFKVAGLVWGLLKKQVGGATASFATHIVAARAVTATHTRLAASAVFAGTALRAMLGPVAFIATSIGLGMLSMRSFSDETERMNDALDQARTQFDDSAGAAEKTASQITSIEGATEGLRNRYDMLTGDSKLLELETQKVKSQFAEMGLKVNQNVSSVDDLIGMLHALRGELREKYIIQLETNLKDGELLSAQLENKLAGSRKGMLDVFQKAGVVRGATRGQAIPQYLEDATVVGVNPDSSFDAINQTVVAMAKALEDEKAAFRAQNGINSTFVKSDDYKLAEALLAELRKILTDKRALDAAKMEVAKVERIQFNADQMEAPGPKALQGRIEALTTTTVASALDGARRGPLGELLQDPIAVAEQAQAIEAGLREEINQITQLLDNLVTQGLTPENEQELRTKLGHAQSTLDAAMEPIEEAASEAEEETRKWALAVSSRIAAGLQRQMGEAETAADVDTIAAQVIEEIHQQDALRVTDAGDDPVKLEAATATLENDLRGVQDSAEKRKQEIIDKTVKELQRVQARIESGVSSFDDDLVRRMDQITDPDLINRITAQRTDAAYAMLEAQLDMLDQIKDEGGEVPQEEYDKIFQEFWSWIRGIQDDSDKALERITDATDKAADEAQKMEIKSLEETNAILAQQESNLLALADKALDIKSRNDLLKAAAAKNAEIAANTLAILDIETPAGVDDGGARDRALALNTEKQIATDRTYADRINSEFKTPGGGGRGKKDKDPIEEFVKGAEARIQAMTIGMEAGVTDPKAGLAQFQNILDEAKVKVEEIGSQMGALQSRMLNGTLTAEEQEKLNTLVAQHVQLTEFLKDNESDLLDLKVEQEGVLANLTPLMQRWSEANLDMTKGMVSGIEQILSGLKSSFGTLFKDLTSGVKSGKEAFRDFAGSVVQSIQNVMAEMLAMYVLQQLIGMLPGGTFKTAAMKFIGQKEGGEVTPKGMAAGGDVKGNLNRDSVTRTLMPEEYVLRRSAAQAIGKDELDKINGMGNTRRSEIGHKGVAKPSAPPAPPSTTNVWVVSPDQQPVMGPNDVLAIIGQDISRGGSIKKMIKSVQNGAM